MKRILGLDLGVGSIGWAYILENEDAIGNPAVEILRMGSRIVPLGSDETDEFTKGNPVTKNQKRRQKRGIRRGYYRYKMRKAILRNELNRAGMMPDEALLRGMAAEELYSLRAKAAAEQIRIDELGRVLLLLNEKRGYKSNRKAEPDEADEKKQSDYLQAIKSLNQTLRERNITVGQLLHERIQEGKLLRGLVFPRASYLEEFDRIWAVQSAQAPDLLNEDFRLRLRDRIIFKQRPLKSQKGLVSECRFERHHKVSPKSSPLNQVCKVWEMVNGISITDKLGKAVEITPDQRKEIFEKAISEGKLAWGKVADLLIKGKHGIQQSLFENPGAVRRPNRKDELIPDQRTKEKGVESNHTADAVRKALKAVNSQRNDLLQFNLKVAEHPTKEEGCFELRINPDYEREPLYRLWHCIYSIEDDDALAKKLTQEFDLDEVTTQALCKLNFTRQGYAAKSSRAIRRILPFLQQGMVYSRACDAAGYRHSDSETTDERLSKELTDAIPEIKKGQLRNPVVERILNQMANVVNAIIADPTLGRPDEIRVELARELRQNADQRNRTYKRNNEREKDNNRIATELEGLGFRKITRSLIEKYRLYHETDGFSLYSGKKLELSAFLKGDGSDVDHIIPQSRLFDDSFANKVISENHLNRDKGDKTALDFMESKGEAEFLRYKEMVNMLLEKGKINKQKRDYLLMAGKDIPEDFVTRQLKETQYITREARNLLKLVARNVWATTGMVTAYLRNEWGWDDVLKQVNLPIYEAAGLTYVVERDGGRKEIRIKEDAWSKRDDHRHHAIDALVTACTRQSYIERLNRLNSANGNEQKAGSLRDFIQKSRPLTPRQVAEKVAGILISFKPGKRVATLGMNKTNEFHTRATGKPVQRPLTPKGALSEESVYGKIKLRDYKAERLGPSFSLEMAYKIADKRLRKLVLDRLLENGNDPTKAFKGYKGNPIYPDGNGGEPLMEVPLISEREEYVIRYKLDQSFKAKDADSIVDKAVREAVKARLALFGDDHKAAFKELENNPIWLNKEKGIAVRTVRCRTGLSKVEAVRTGMDGKPDAFVMPGNNHHIAIYRDRQGMLQENTVTFWNAFERKKLGIPVVIKNPASVWDHVLQKVLPTRSEAEAEQLALAMEAKLPRPDWEFVVSLEQNEMFVWRMSIDELKEAIQVNDLQTIAKNLYRVQKIAKKDYFFRLHSETRVDDKLGAMKAVELGKLITVKSLEKMKGIKVRVNNLGRMEVAEP